MKRILAMMFALFFLASCGGGGGTTDPVQPPPATSNKSNQSDLDTLLAAADEATWAYAESLAIFSADGTVPLFGADAFTQLSYDAEGVDDAGGANMIRISAAVEQLLAFEEPLAEALTSLDAKAVLSENPAQPLAQKVIYKSIIEFFTQGKNTHKSFAIASAETIKAAVATDPGQLQRYYDALKSDQAQDETRFKSVDFGANAEEFIERLTDGTLDKSAAHIHDFLYHYPDDDFDFNYATKAQELDLKPNQITAEAGKALVEKGASLYIDIVNYVSPDLGKGIGYAQTVVDKLKDAEDEATELSEFAKDGLQQRIEENFPANEGYREMLQAADLPVSEPEVQAAGVAAGVRRFVQNTEKQQQHLADLDSQEVAELMGLTWDYGHIVAGVSPSSEDISGAVVSWESGDARDIMVVPGVLADGAVLSVPTPDAASVGVVLQVLSDSDAADDSVVQQIEAVVTDGGYTPIFVDVAEPEVEQPMVPVLSVTPSSTAVTVGVDVQFAVVVPDTFFGPYTLEISRETTGEQLQSLQLNSRTHSETLVFNIAEDFVLTFTVTDTYGQSVSADVTITVTEEPTAEAVTYWGELSFWDTEDDVYVEIAVTTQFRPDGSLVGIVEGYAYYDYENPTRIEGEFTGSWDGTNFTASGTATATTVIDEVAEVDTFGFNYSGTYTVGDDQIIGQVDVGGEPFTLERVTD